MANAIRSASVTTGSFIFLCSVVLVGCGGGSSSAAGSAGATPLTASSAGVITTALSASPTLAMSLSPAGKSITSPVNLQPVSVTLAPAVLTQAAVGQTNPTQMATQPEVSVARIVLPPVTAVSVGKSIQFVASTVDSAGAVVSGVPLSWSIADTSVAQIDSSGLVTPIHAGFTTVTASYKDVQAKTVISISGPVDIPTRSKNAGVNLSGLAYYGTSFPFCDLMKSGGGWWSNNADGSFTQSTNSFPAVSPSGEPLALLPGQKAVSPIAWSNVNYPAGQYTVLWEGSGNIIFPLTSVTIKDSGPHRIVIEPNKLAEPMFVGFDKTDPLDPIHNLRVLLPGTESTCATQIFNEGYLKRIAPFSVLRMMDWGATNGSPIVEWADRPHVDDVSYALKGVPIEVMIDLANTLHANPWFNIPHMASDDYIKKFAALVHIRLDPTLRPRIEYSNEMWNFSFPQLQWGVKQSNLLGLPTPWGMPSIYHAKRSVEIFKLIRTEFGADAFRLVRILAGQAGWTQFLENGLAYADTATNVDAISIAPYFTAGSASDPKNVAVSKTLSPDQFIDQMFLSIRGEINGWIVANAALATKYNLGLTAYESGLGDVTYNYAAADQDPMTALYVAAGRNPRMKDLYNEYFTLWTNAGGGTMNQFNDVSPWTKFGFWGLLEYVTQAVETSPKYQGLMQFINAHPTAPCYSLTAQP